MKHHHKMLVVLLGTYCALAWSAQRARSQEKAASSTVQVHLVITDMGLRDDEVPILRREDVKVKQGKTMRQVAQLIAAQGDNAALQLFVLIDDTLSSAVGNNLNDVRDFINAQPPTTVIGVGYMSNTTVSIVQNFTPDHALTA